MPWALRELPQAGDVLDIGSCDATYLAAVQTVDRRLECLDPRPCAGEIPDGALFHRESLFGNSLAASRFDAVLLLSVLEHLGLPTYGQPPVRNGLIQALAECWRLVRPGGLVLASVPAGIPKTTSWYRQFSPERLRRLFQGWQVQIEYWGFLQGEYVPIRERDVLRYDYRDRFDATAGAGAVALISARRR